MLMMSRAGLILVGLLALILALFPEACVAQEGGQHCTPSSCGNIRNVSYPFRLNSDPLQCGHQNYELACENNRTTFYESGRKYYVQGIDYVSHTMKVVDATLDMNSCSILNYSFTDLNLNSPYSLIYDTASVLLNCTQPVNSSSVYVDVTPCINDSSSPQTNFYPFYTNIKQVSDLHGMCNIQLVVPALQSLNITGSGLAIADINEELLKGFHLSYSSYTPSLPPPPFGAGVTKLSFMERVKQRIQNILDDLWYSLFTTYGYHKLFGGRKFDSDSYTGWVGSRIIKGYVIGRTSVGILFLIVLSIYRFQQRHLSADKTIEEFLQSHNNFMPIRYSYKQIKLMTKSFKDKLGQGGFGSVYKGKLQSGDIVAVKVLGTSKANGQDFINEVATMGRIHHVNVVRLIGFCVEGSKRALIFDFMTNGSLDKFIFRKEELIGPLSWKKMHEIGLGMARGIEYLHRGCEMQILHFDIKPHNILLDENLNPKISDFGLAKLYPIDDSIVSLTAARGTLGYIAPELFYKNIGGVSYKADVYSFGMLLMDMVGRRKNVNAFADHSSQIYFPSWVYDRISQGEDIELGDANEDEKRIARKMIIVALWCTQMKPTDRPSMREVLEMLEGEVELLKMPPKPLLRPQENSVVDHADNNIPRGAPLSYNDIGTITLDGR